MISRIFRRPATALLAILSTAAAHAASYHIDPAGGDDKSPGTSPETAWKSLERANAHIFKPGDQLLLKAGARFTGSLRPQGSGSVVDGKPKPILLGKYGEGPRPRIDGEGRTLDTLLLRNVEFWQVRDLEITNQGPQRAPWRTGVRIVSDGFGKMRHIHLHHLFVHDVNGDLRKEHEGCGIYFETRGGNHSHFDDLLIEDCHLVRTDRNGICQRNGSRTRSLRVVIRRNRLEDIGGDGIKIWGSDGALVEHNVIRGGRMRCKDHAAGIWPFDSDDTVIQFNEVSGMKGVLDGQGFDADYRCRRTLIQYNYSHDNEGGFLLVCSPGNSWNENTVVRYNISRNDGIGTARVFHLSGSTGTRIYQNTIHVAENQDLPMVLCTNWNGGVPRDLKFTNNLFLVDGRVTYDIAKARDIVFENNQFYGRHENRPPDARAVTTRPDLVDPVGGNGFESLKGYQPRNAAACIPGMILPDPGTRDFFGRPLPENIPPCIGAAQAGEN
jgi:hypothetical protein